MKPEKKFNTPRSPSDCFLTDLGRLAGGNRDIIMERGIIESLFFYSSSVIVTTFLMFRTGPGYEEILTTNF